MYLYNLTLNRPSAIVQAVYGNFSGPKAQEIIVGRGKILELLRPDENGKIQSILSVDIFGVIRSIVPFRLTGGTKDYIIVGSDSGRIVILEYNPQKNVFDKVHQETFGKSGCRRITPGQYLAVDPKGRAVMIGAIEKQKLVYILNRDSASNLTISSPLEAHKANTIHYAICGVDVGFDNPIFASIEQNYEGDEGEGAEKYLTYYRLDLGLNHVTRGWTERIHPKSNLLIAVPGGNDGPGGVLVCAEDFVFFKNQDHPEIVAEIPRRKGSDPTRGVLIVATTTHRMRDKFFFLLQSEYGDLYKVTLSYKDETVQKIHVTYFDSIPTCVDLAVMKAGFLFAASEFGNHGFYQFQSLGDEATPLEELTVTLPDGSQEVRHFFEPRGLVHLGLIDEVESLSPIVAAEVMDLAMEGTPQLYALCGRGSRSALRVLRHGLPVGEMAVSPLPGNPSAVWTVRSSLHSSVDRYIVVSFVNATLILSIGETVEEATDTPFSLNVPTLLMANVGEEGLLQVYPGGMRYVREGKPVHEWKPPGKKTVSSAATNGRQIVLALTGGDLLLFEVDAAGNLSEVDKKFMGREIACLDVGPIPEGRQRSRFLAVGDWDNTVRIFSLDPEDSLKSLSVQALPTHPESLNLVSMSGYAEGEGTLFLNIGLNNGVLLRSVVDSVTGELTDTRTRFLGARGVRLFKLKVRGAPAALALSSRPWLCYSFQNRFQMAPLSYLPLEFATPFASEQCPEGVVAVAGNTLRIFTIERLGEMFNQTEVPLLYTPRKMVVHPLTNQLITIETDHNAIGMGIQSKAQRVKTEGEDMEVEGETEEKDPFNVTDESYRILGNPRPGPGHWASCLRLFDSKQNKTLDLIEFTDNEAALSLCTVVFGGHEGEVFLVVGTARDMQLQPQRCSAGVLHVFRLVENRFEFIHRTDTETVPAALCAFQGRLLVGLGKTLRIYDLGKKKLLRKCENKNFPFFISHLFAQGDRIYVSDIQEGIHFVKYKKEENKIYAFADQVTPRWVTSFQCLDYDTVAMGDKFGNIFVSRVPPQTSEEIDEDPTGSKLKIEQGWMNGAPHRLDDIAIFHTGETITSVRKAALVPGGAEFLLYSTSMGSLGALVPFTSREDVDFFLHLEMYLRQENPPLCGRDHLSYRSYYYPVRNVIDGDLCEQFSTLDATRQKAIADELLRTPMEVLKKLEDIRNRLL